MKTIRDYKKRLIELVILLTKSDLDNWYVDSEGDYIIKFKNTELCFRKNRYFLVATNKSDWEYISFIPLNIKLYRSYRKVKKHIKIKKINDKNSTHIEIYKDCITDIESSIVKEIRKEKLDKINEE